MATENRMTIAQHFRLCTAKYEKVIDCTEDTRSEEYQKPVLKLLDQLKELWQHLQAVGAMSANEELDEISTPALGMLIVPYMIGDLHMRIVDPAIPRERILAVSKAFYEKFIRIALDLELTTEREAEMGMESKTGFSRIAKVELSKAQTALRTKINDLDSRMGFIRARDRRMRRLEMEDDDEIDEAGEAGPSSDAVDDDALLQGEGGELEELQRERAITHLKWCIGETYLQVQMVGREAEMLSMLSEDQRRKVAEEYQKGIEETRNGLNKGRATYTILPGGQIATSGEGRDLLREKVRQQAFTNPNMPTMSLAEFAESEMASVQEQMEKEAEAKNAQEIEDALLGVEGVEERDRQKQAAWDDWRDDNPPIGITTKGNYS